MSTELSALEERIANTKSGAITSIQAVYVPADDLTDPSAEHVFSHLSASIVLSRKRAAEGLYPAIDLLQSNSNMATPGIAGERHYQIAQDIRKTLAQYEALKDIVAMLGLDQLSPEDRSVVARARRLERFLTQPFFTTEQFSGIKGQSVSLKDALDGCERILKDEFKDYPESALYMIGSIDQAKKEPAKTPDDKSNASDKSQNTSVPNATANPAPDKQPDATAKPDAEKKQDADKKPDVQTSKSEVVAGA
jgi:F-type H+-transporting ATPase subunit beta